METQLISVGDLKKVHIFWIGVRVSVILWIIWTDLSGWRVILIIMWWSWIQEICFISCSEGFNRIRKYIVLGCNLLCLWTFSIWERKLGIYIKAQIVMTDMFLLIPKILISHFVNIKFGIEGIFYVNVMRMHET